MEITKTMKATPASGSPSRTPDAWQPLLYYGVYRALLAGILVVLVEWGPAPRPLGSLDLGLFRVTAVLYLAFGVLGGIGSFLRRPAFEFQVILLVFGDIAFLTVLMHASGGLSSGFGMLLVVAIAGGSILIAGRIAILFAALASLAVLAQQMYTSLHVPFGVVNYPHAGMLGAAFFATAYLAHVSARRIRASEALAAERAVDLANLAELNDHIIQRMQSGILAIDGERCVRLLNKSAQRLLALPGASSGMHLGAAAPALDSLLDRWQRDPSRSSYLVQPEGSALTLQASFAAIGRGAAEGVLVFLEDAGVIHQRAQQLKLASLGRLAASIAHEIRNPLSAMSHANQLLEESRHLDRGEQRLTRIISENARRMNAIVEDVLQIGRGKPAVPETIEVKGWLERFVADFTAGNPIEPESLRTSVDPPTLRVRVDPSQLRQVLWNLCENGLQHTDGAPPLLEVRAGIAADTHRPFLEVQDNGEGLAPGAAEQLFEPFYTTRPTGTGLGLYIARELCAGNQATLQHVPCENGCRFRVTFSDPRRQEAVPA